MTAAHQFARSKASGVKYIFPHGNASARVEVCRLPTHAELSGVPVQCETCSSIQPARQMHPHASGLQCHTCQAGTTRQLVREVAGTADDFEFYPTTDEIISAIRADLVKLEDEQYFRPDTVLDIGAGSGKVLQALRDDQRLHFTAFHAIEKSLPLLQAMPPDFLVVGTDLREQNLLNKAVQVTFSNPPYSVFEEWTVKIIRESCSSVIYLVIPQRWQGSSPIADALSYAGKVAHVLGSFSFDQSGADRQARAQVHLLRIEFAPIQEPDDAESMDWRRRAQFRRRAEAARQEPFERQFYEQFSELLRSFASGSPKAHEHSHTAPDKFAALVPGEGYAAALVSMYRADLAHVERNYAAASQLDGELLRELDISPAKICEALKARLSGLRNKYWHELFSHLGKITERLTSSSRNTLLGQLHKHVHVDFTLSNIEAVVLWVLKNANRCFDDQLVSVFEKMVAKCNVTLYKSNRRAFVEGWRYSREESQNSHYALDYRIITHRVGSMNRYSWKAHELSDGAATFLEDLRTVAHNLGFRRQIQVSAAQMHWTRGESKDFYCITPKGNELLFSVRAFDNGNLHFKLNKKFILALNVEHGRLKGWLRTPKEAAEELGDASAAQLFKTNLALPAGDNLLKLLS